MKQGMGYNSGHRNTRVNSKSQVQPIYWRGFVNLCGIHFEDLPNLYILKYTNKWNNGTWQSEVSDSTSYSLLTVMTFFRWNGLYLVITGIFGPPENGTHSWSLYWGLSGVSIVEVSHMEPMAEQVLDFPGEGSGYWHSVSETCRGHWGVIKGSNCWYTELSMAINDYLWWSPCDLYSHTQETSLM